jgi:hypothetical protein
LRQISDLEQKIRDFVNNHNLYDKYFKNHFLDEWIILCVSMDILGDTCLALEYYENSGLGDKDGEKYLNLYGLLQAIFLQQDAICQLFQIFMKSNLKPDANSEWMRIRYVRNLVAGHPIEKKDKKGTKRCLISRATIQSDTFQLIVWKKEENKDEIEDVELKSLFNKYKSESIKHLETIYQAQIKNWSSL